MTTAAWATVLDQSSDAGFRNWGSEFSGKAAACGMVQTADTGQINWTTITRGATINTAVGYEIWRLSSSNLYFKVEYGTGSVTLTSPSMWMTIGTGSNGSGTLTGQLSTRTQLGFISAPTSTVTNYQSYMCATANYWGFAWKNGSAVTINKSRIIFVACQTVDSTGAATSVGYAWFNANASNSCTGQSVATAAGVTAAVTSGVNFFFIPQVGSAPPNSLDGSGNNQAFLWWHNVFGSSPMQPLLHTATVLASDLGVGASASMTLIGSTPHTYLAASTSMCSDAASEVAASSLSQLLLFE